MKPGDLRRFDYTPRNREYNAAGKIFLVFEIDSGPVPAWVSFLMDGNLKQHWSYDFVVGCSKEIDETR